MEVAVTPGSAAAEEDFLLEQAPVAATSPTRATRAMPRRNERCMDTDLSLVTSDVGAPGQPVGSGDSTGTGAVRSRWSGGDGGDDARARRRIQWPTRRSRPWRPP